jgi:hypothetical protein
MLQWSVDHCVPETVAGLVGAFLLVVFARSLKNRWARASFVVLYGVGWSCTIFALWLANRGHYLSAVPVNHVVHRDEAGRCYYSPTGFDIRHPISADRAAIYDRYRAHSRRLATVGIPTFMLALVAFAWLSRWESKRQANVPIGLSQLDDPQRTGSKETLE